MVTLETVKERRWCLFVDGVETVDRPQDMSLEPEGHGGAGQEGLPRGGEQGRVDCPGPLLGGKPSRICNTLASSWYTNVKNPFLTVF